MTTLIDRLPMTVDATAWYAAPIRHDRAELDEALVDLAAMRRPQPADRRRRCPRPVRFTVAPRPERSSSATSRSGRFRRRPATPGAPTRQGSGDRTGAAHRRAPPRPAGRVRARTRRAHRAEHRADARPTPTVRPPRRRGPNLMFHTETAFHPHRPRYLLLLCLRGDPAARHHAWPACTTSFDVLADRRPSRRCSNRATAPPSMPASSTAGRTSSAR